MPKKILFLVFILLWISPFVSGEGAKKAPSAPPARKPVNIILLIGDGMGVAALTAAKIEKGALALEEFPVAGFVTTWAHDALVTDSAAAATALATGRKTQNGAVGVDEHGKPLRSVVEDAAACKIRTGVVATSGVTHATPAAFLAHVSSRKEDFLIAEHIAASPAHLVMGGGREHFLPKGAGGKREDGRDLLAEMKKRGFCIEAGISNLSTTSTCSKVAVFLADGHMPPVKERRPALAEMTRAALDYLARGGGRFFLMVEGSQIDWGGHGNDAAFQTAETVDFDDAVAEALRFAKTRGDTLVLVTSDHETGGFAVMGGDLAKKRAEGKFLTKDHTAEMVPLFAHGPESARFGGIRDNAEVGRMIRKILTEGCAEAAK